MTFGRVFGRLHGQMTFGRVLGRLHGQMTFGRVPGRLHGQMTFGRVELHVKSLGGNTLQRVLNHKISILRDLCQFYKPSEVYFSQMNGSYLCAINTNFTLYERSTQNT